MVPAKKFSFPSIAIVVSGPSFDANICEYEELTVVLNDACIPGTSFGIAGHARKLLDVGSRVLVSRHESHERDLTFPLSRVGTVESSTDIAKIGNGQLCFLGFPEPRWDIVGLTSRLIIGNDLITPGLEVSFRQTWPPGHLYVRPGDHFPKRAI